MIASPRARLGMSVLAILSLLGAVLFFRGVIGAVSQPRSLRVAISRLDTVDGAILRAFDAELRERRQAFVLDILEVDDSRDAARALAEGRVDLGIVRPDADTPSGASALVLMRTSPLILVSRKGSNITTLGDLEGKVVGMDSRDAGLMSEINSVFAQTQRQQATPRPVAAEDIETALAQKRIDVALFTPSLRKGQAGPALVRQLSREGGKVSASAASPDDVSGMVASLRQASAKDSGLPVALRGEDDDDVVSVLYLLMARNTLDAGTVAAFTERLFYARAAIAKRAGRPANFTSAAGETVTASLIPLHKGAIDYFEREQKTFLERWSDLIWIGLAFSGMVSSGFAWLTRRISRRRERHAEALQADIAIFIDTIPTLPDIAQIMALDQQADELHARLVELVREDHLSGTDRAALKIALARAQDKLVAARISLMHERT